MISRKLLAFFAALLFLSLPHPLLAQAVSATLLGTVTDPTGATVAGAKVTATETATGVIHESVTNASGNYTFPDLKPGTYSVTVEAPASRRTPIRTSTLLINSSTRVDIDLRHRQRLGDGPGNDRARPAADRPRRHQHQNRSATDRRSCPSPPGATSSRFSTWSPE